MSRLPHLVAVEFDQSMHPDTDFDSLDAQSKIAFAALDTAYKLLRESAVRVTLQAVREAAAEQGQTLEADEELFRQATESGDPDAPTGYADLAPDVPLAALGLHGAFGLLVDAATAEAAEAFGTEAEDADGS
jgi:hypothetical protein